MRLDQLVEDIYQYVYVEEISVWKVAVNGYLVMVLVTEILAKILLII